MNPRSVLECSIPLTLCICGRADPAPKAPEDWRSPRPGGSGRSISAFCFQAWEHYSIQWFTICDGGGTSTGGFYSISGTIVSPTWAR